ncbi:unnamed protein product [Rotaria magnacalcarata]|uniref:Cytochrome b-c1 complex subunit Rieske transmembrane domain-containing protein n=1 Tax=Rotaria magnacalcarata TaxID=392030 RepID=A0A816YE95_9BILA|nr:unnamed protein product [Rotaria magnacalcarata]CAF2157624.1 unnamed protein product [Rotaria magnacalcarata]
MIHDFTKLNFLCEVTRIVRRAHTDIQVPEFNYYRTKRSLDPFKSYRDSGDVTSPYSYLTPIGITIIFIYVLKNIIRDVVAYIGPAKDVISDYNCSKIDLSCIPEGKTAVFEWQKLPVFVRHRTQEEIARESNVDLQLLRDPEKDSDRVTKPEWLVVVAMCTRLGEIPISNAGEYRGFYCPCCCDSHYDASGRIRKGRARFNLVVPPYRFQNEHTIVIGRSRAELNTDHLIWVNTKKQYKTDKPRWITDLMDPLRSN